MDTGFYQNKKEWRMVYKGCDIGPISRFMVYSFKFFLLLERLTWKLYTAVHYANQGVMVETLEKLYKKHKEDISK